MKIIFALILSFVSLSAFAQYNGVPFVGDTARCQYISDDISPAQQQVIVQNMGQHVHRLYHWLWHSTRNGWASLSPEEQAAARSLSPQWGQNAPLCPYPSAANGNPAGEEFLRMHHGMIDFLRGQLVARGLPCITGWKTIPLSGDPAWPAPPGTADDSSKGPEMEHLLQIWGVTFMNWPFLQAHTLSEVGFLLEFSIHNNLHMRWSAIARPGDDFSPFAAGSPSLNSLLANSPYDNPYYNYLGNPYNSAVNPVFWKIHGWVDNVIVEWLHANNYTYIADNCGGTAGCYQWRSTWIGGMDHAAMAPSTGGPVGGGMPGMSMRGSPGLDQVLAKLVPAASFRNRAFDNFLSSRRSGGPIGGGAGGQTAQAENFDNPEAFVGRFGPPCAAP